MTKKIFLTLIASLLFLGFGCGTKPTPKTLSNPAPKVQPTPSQPPTPQKAPTPSPTKPDSTKNITINSHILTETEITAFVQTYNQRPEPGNYWYDTRSGLYGAIGYPAYGFLQPGHHYGTIRRDASRGATGVIINGRDIPQSEWLVLSGIVGSYIQPGAYWLDANGNAGYEGNDTPLVNLYVAAQANNYKGSGGSGDRSWSSRFSAGNSNTDNSQGYVSVPGYGPVGYGF